MPGKYTGFWDLLQGLCHKKIMTVTNTVLGFDQTLSIFVGIWENLTFCNRDSTDFLQRNGNYSGYTQ
jgi:hypothetical protein